MSRADVRGAASLIGKSRRRTVGAAVGALAAGGVAIVVVLSTTTGSSRGASPIADAKGAATVQRRDLVATDTESGTLGYAGPQTVFNRLSGTITWLPGIGRLVRPGQALYKVDGAPVVLFDGTTPAYRDLASGVSDGADVKELNANLVRLGYDPSHEITIDDSWQAGTTAAVEGWQSAHGMTETGTIPLGQIVFLPGAQRITAVDTTLGSTGSSSAGAASASGADYVVGSSRPEYVDLSSSVATTPTTATTTPGASPTRRATTPPPPTTPPANQGTQPGKAAVPSSQAALLALLRAETLELKKTLSSQSGASTAKAGTAKTGTAKTGAAATSAAPTSAAGTGGGTTGAGASAEPILQTSSTHLVVSVDLDATKQSEASVGEPVTVQMPTGKVVRGKITEVSPVAASSSSSSASSSASTASGSGSASTTGATIPVTIALKGKQARTGLDQAAVSVNFEQQVEKHVLSVPVTALLATAGGGYEVQQAAAPHKLIPITPGLFAAGYVQISGPGIVSGLQVTDSQG
jgi:hypothetical protein